MSFAIMLKHADDVGKLVGGARLQTEGAVAFCKFLKALLDLVKRAQEAHKADGQDKR